MSVRDGLQKHALVAVLLALWAPLVGVGLRVLLQYAYTPGRAAKAPRLWPPDSPILQEPGRATLVVFAHPRCPCSRATIGELAWIMARCRETADANVLFYCPSTEDKDWARTDLWRSATAIPGVHAMVDRDGAAARHFGAATSGQTLLYDSHGRLLFQGGITASRGHFGSNDGRDAIVALLLGARPRQDRTPVFGCSLAAEE